MIVNKNGLGFGEEGLKTGSATITNKDMIVLKKNETRYITYPLTMSGYVSTISMGVKVRVESYTLEGNLILIPNNVKELVSNTSSIEQVWTIPEGAGRGYVQVTMNFSYTTMSVILKLETWNLVGNDIRTQVTLENAVIYYNYQTYDNIIEIDQNSIKLHKNTTAHGTLTIGGDVSIGGSLTIPSNKSITVDKLESGPITINSMTNGSITISSMTNGSVVIDSMTNGSVVISNKTGGTAQINGVVIEDSGGGEFTTITVPRGEKASSMVNEVWYYVPAQTITEAHTFTIQECVIKGGSTYNNFVYSVPNLTSASITYSLVVRDNKIQISKHTLASSYTDTTTYHDLVKYYTTDVKFV